MNSLAASSCHSSSWCLPEHLGGLVSCGSTDPPWRRRPKKMYDPMTTWMYRLLQSTMNSVAYVREYGRSEDIPHLRRDFVGRRRRWSRRNCQGLSSSWNEEIRNANSAPRQENRAVKWRRMKRGFRWKTRMAMKKGCSRRRENRGQWMR
jgi:hypothetical protein